MICQSFFICLQIHVKKKIYSVICRKLVRDRGGRVINPPPTPVLTALNVMQNFGCIFILIKSPWCEKAVVGEIVTKVIGRIIRVNYFYLSKSHFFIHFFTM